MKIDLKKTKTEHHLMSEFHKLLLKIEQNPKIKRMIPGRIERQQKGSSETRFRISYSTKSGIKCIMSKGATAQELFIICQEEDKEDIKKNIKNILTNHKEITHTFKAIRNLSPENTQNNTENSQEEQEE